MNRIVLFPLAEPLIEPASRSKSPEHLPALDGVRGLAILMVLLYHLTDILRAYPFLRQGLTIGWISVDLFFVLSGFLITRILVSTREDDRYFSRFHLRRGLRIWPLYFTYVLVLYFGLHFIAQIGSVQRFVATSQFFKERSLQLSYPLIVYLLFIQNLLGSNADISAVTWFVCIEQHFYLIWPILVRRYSIEPLKKILWTAFWLSPVLRLVYFFLSRHRGASFQWTYDMIFHATPFRLDSIIAGCLLGLYSIEWKQPERLRSLFFRLFAAGIVLFPVVWQFTERQSALCCFSFSVFAVLCTGLMGLVLLGWSQRFFLNPALRYFGTISLGFYLFHAPIVTVFQSHAVLRMIFPFHNVYLLQMAGAVCATALSFAVATLSWNFFEKPILSLKYRLAP
jgi:peptidoglycan/LPS O-acetylase OafA/YrhL